MKKEFFVAGGAGNVAVNLAALGAKPVMVSVVGQDLGGEMLKGFLREKNVNIYGVAEDPDRPTTQKIRVMADQQQIARFDRESKKVISEDNRVRIYYRLTEEGYAHLDKLKDLYADLISTVQSIIYEED